MFGKFLVDPSLTWSGFAVGFSKLKWFTKAEFVSKEMA
jgi:hypothetical protein